MSKAKRERIVLGLLLAVLVFAGWNLWQSFRPTPSTSAGSSEVVVPQSVDTDQFESLNITSDWAAGLSEDSEGDNRNPFQYGAALVPERPQAPVAQAPEPAIVRPPPVRAPVPPPPPPLPLQYVGFSRVGGPAAELRAVLMGDDGLPYPAVAGETLMGRYRIQEITEEFVVVEDVQAGRRERLPVNLED